MVVVTSDWLGDCCMSRIDPKSMVTNFSVLRSSCDFYIAHNYLVCIHTDKQHNISDNDFMVQKIKDLP